MGFLQGLTTFAYRTLAETILLLTKKWFQKARSTMKTCGVLSILGHCNFHNPAGAYTRKGRRSLQ